MGEGFGVKVWIMRALYVAIAFALIFLNLLPLQTLPQVWAGPDLILALTFAWVLRRPEYVPPFLVALIMLLGDFLYHRPPGLWAALILIGAETLRARYNGLRDLTFMAEWAAISSTLVVMTVAYHLLLALLLVDQAPFGLSLIQLLMTLLCYPIVAIVSQFIFGVRKPAHHDIDALGGRV